MTTCFLPGLSTQSPLSTDSLACTDPKQNVVEINLRNHVGRGVVVDHLDHAVTRPISKCGSSTISSSIRTAATLLQPALGVQAGGYQSTIGEISSQHRAHHRRGGEGVGQ